MTTNLDELFQQFLRERKYLRNVSPRTIEWCETAWQMFQRSATSCPADAASLNPSHLEQFVIALRDRGVRPVTCNTWLKALDGRRICESATWKPSGQCRTRRCRIHSSNA